MPPEASFSMTRYRCCGCSAMSPFFPRLCD